MGYMLRDLHAKLDSLVLLRVQRHPILSDDVDLLKSRSD